MRITVNFGITWADSGEIGSLHGRVCRKPETACRARRVLSLHKCISYYPFYRPLTYPISAHRIK